MTSAVYDVHHRYRETVCIHATKETVQRDLKCSRSRTAACNGYCQDCICSEVGFIFCPVCFFHCCIHCINIRCIFAFQCFIDHGVDVCNCFCHTFTAKTFFIMITKFQSLELSCGSSTWCSPSSDRTVSQINFCFYGWIASGVDDFPSNYFFNC